MGETLPYFPNPAYLQDLPEPLRRLSTAVDFRYEPDDGGITLVRPISVNFYQRMIDSWLNDGTLTVDDLMRLVHLQLLHDASVRYRWMIKLDHKAQEVRVLVAYLVTWGAVPWCLECTDEDIDVALRLLPEIVRQLQEPVPEVSLSNWGHPDGPCCC